MNIPRGHFIQAPDLYRDFDLDKIKLPMHGRKLDNCGKFFSECMKMVIDDVINKNIEFNFSNAALSRIYLDRITGDDFKLMFRKGAFLNVDFIKTNFSAYNLVFDSIPRKGFPIKRTLLTDAKRYEKIQRLSNEEELFDDLCELDEGEVS